MSTALAQITPSLCCLIGSPVAGHAGSDGGGIGGDERA